MMSHRSGNALVLAFGISAMVASMVLISSTSTSQVVQSNTQRTFQLRCMAAVEAVLQRREAAVIAMAQDGSLLAWTGRQGIDEPNFGEDYVGGCRVRWKIEPMRTLIADEAPGAPIELPYVTNPNPNVNAGANDADQAPNTVTYLYRVAAEAALLQSAPDPLSSEPPVVLARAQGVRAVSATNNPLFRYVINYAARGPKGDLELSHGPPLNITGNVYSGGSIYIGAEVAANDWIALSGPAGQTTIVSAVPGPARVWGLDGIYRLSKPLMYARLNGLPIANAPGALGTPTDAHYDMKTPSYPNEATPPNLTGESFALATNNGRLINPRRVKASTGLVPAAGPTVPARTINGVEVTSDNAGGNDSRDLERTDPTRKWANTSFESSPTTFAGRVQSLDTGATQELIDPQIAGEQALEAQLLLRVEADGDPVTDEHHLYRPLFIDSSGNRTTTIPSTQPVEAPGVYMGFALGSGLAMQRRADNSGWYIVNQVGGGTPGIPETGSLIIRERLIPDTNLWPGIGGDANALVSANSPDYLPFAYGKHWRPTVMPATPIDVTDNLFESNTNNTWSRIANGGGSPTTQRTANVPNRSVAYTGAGGFTIVTGTGLLANGSEQLRASIPPNSNPGGQNYTRVHRYVRDNWRFLHLKSRHGKDNADIAALPGTGLRAYVWRGDNLSKRLLGVPEWTGIDAQLDGAFPWAPAAAPPGFPTDHFSVRWEGYLVLNPTDPADQYTLNATHDDGMRIWVDDQLVYERWTSGSGNSVNIELTPERPARIVVDYFENDGSQNAVLRWQAPSRALQVIPSANLRPAPVIPGFDRSQLTDVVAKVDLDGLRVAGSPPDQKVGLMLREGFGVGNLLNGRDRYIALAVNPARGIFVERRMQASVIERPSATATDYWVGSGQYQEGANPAVPTVNGNLGIQTDRTDGTYTVTRSSLIELANSTFINPYADWYHTTNTQSGVTNITGPTTTTDDLKLSESVNLSGWRYGPWQVRRTRTEIARERWRSRGEFRYDFVTYRGAYPPSPYAVGDRPLIRFFAAVNTETTTTVFQEWVVNGYNVVNRTYPAPLPGAGRALQRIEFGPNESLGVLSATKTTTITAGDLSENAVWAPAGGWPSGWTASQVAAKLNEVSWRGRTDWTPGQRTGTIVRTGLPNAIYTPPTGNPGDNPTIDNIAQMDFTLAELPDPPATVLTNPTPPLPAGQYSFSVPSSNIYHIDIDVNPMVGRLSRWGDVAQQQIRPWSTLWKTNYNLDAPLTRSFRPDLWANAQVAPISTTTAIQPRSLPNYPQGSGGAPLDDIIPAGWAAWSSVWLRIVHGANGALTFQYANGSLPAGAPGNPWVSIAVEGGVSLGNPGGTADADVWSDSLLVGLAAQSGNVSQITTANFSEVAVTTSESIGNGDGVWNSTDWEAVPLPGAASPYARYMASQYQVFFANQDITEDFFSWADQVGGVPIATESWIYNTREFWSQNRRWDHGVEKDLTGGVYSHNTTTTRQLLAKSTMLVLNQGRLWQYFRERTLAQAMTAVMQGSTPPSAGVDATLSARFNGLVYAARTNRYPFNPDPGNPNPWNAASGSLVLPNGPVGQEAANLNTTDNATHPGFLFNGIHKLQPYGLAAAPPFRPQQFHHGVMITNGAALNWGDFTPPPPATAPPLGTGATSIVTPNPLFVVGNLNTNLVTVETASGDQNRPVPMSIMGDSINFLSNGFQIANYQTPGFTSSGTGFLGGALGRHFGYAATNTTYYAAIVTYNQPSTLDRVTEGQSAAVIDTMLFMEDWNGRTMTYNGSLVVLGSRRYTESFLLNVPKNAGRTPFGTLPADWSGVTNQVYRAPVRVLGYNIDLLTPQGTPPFAPSGVTTASVGGWVRIVQ